MSKTKLIEKALDGQQARLAACAEVSKAMRGFRSVFEHTADSFDGGITYILWISSSAELKLTVASGKGGASYYDVRERLSAPKGRRKGTVMSKTIDEEFVKEARSIIECQLPDITPSRQDTC